MRVLLLVNNWIGWQIAAWLKKEEGGQGHEIVGLVLHPPHRRKFGEEIIQELALPRERIFDGARLRQPEVQEAILTLQPEMGLSAMFGYILRQEFLNGLPMGCVNIHPALLPYNRGAFPNVWSIIDETPAGVTMHYIDAGVDTGDIIGQREVVVEPVDTGESLYRKLEQASLVLFKEMWPQLLIGQAARRPQIASAGTHHRVQDVEKVDEIDLDRLYTSKELINIIRARTFTSHRGAYFRHNGRRIYLRLQLQEAEEA